MPAYAPSDSDLEDDKRDRPFVSTLPSLPTIPHNRASGLSTALFRQDHRTLEQHQPRLGTSASQSPGKDSDPGRLQDFEVRCYHEQLMAVSLR
jgi:hypothetical protein